MKRRDMIKAMAALPMISGAMVGLGALPARAEANTVRLAISPGFGFLPVYVVISEKLIEKHAAANGLPDVQVEVSNLTGGAAQNDALLAGTVDLVVSGVPPFLILWDKTIGRGDVKALCSVATMPLYLNTRNPDVQTIEDFSEADRIALASPTVGPHAIVLQMEAAKRFGVENFNKLDALTVGLPQPEAMAALLSGKTEITGHFTVPPYQYFELEQEGIRRVLSSYDVLGGASSFQLAWTTSKFYDENPNLVKSIYAALREAADFIKADPQRAGEIYLETTCDRMPVEKVVEMVRDPEMQFTLTPSNVMRQAEFLGSTGRLENKPQDWKDLFFPIAHGLIGS